MDPYPNLIASIFLLLLNLLLTVGSESLKNLNKTQLNRKVEEGSRTAAKIASLMGKGGRFFRAAMSTGRTVCKILAIALILSAYKTPLSEQLSGNVTYPGTVATLLLSLAVAVAFLLFAEIFPIRIAEQKADKLLFPVWGLLRTCTAPFYLIALPINALVSLLLKITGFRQEAEEAPSKEDIQTAVEVSGENGLLQEAEQEMLEGILKFDEKTADQVMTPRTEVFLIDADQPMKEQLEEALREKYSRVPVYRGEIDNIIGILYLKDILCEAYRVGFENLDITKCMREVYFVPEKKKLDRLFRDLQETKYHMAVLIDEYGGFSGIVTIEDLIEEVMGNIEDEYDDAEVLFRTDKDGSILAQGAASISDVNGFLSTEFDEEDDDYDTLSGLIVKILGYIPAENDHPTVEHEGYSFRVESVSDRRIDWVRITKLPEETDTDGEEGK